VRLCLDRWYSAAVASASCSMLMILLVACAGGMMA